MSNESILVIGPSWVGDMVMAQPFFYALKQRWPNASLDVLAPAWSAPLLARMPEVRQALTLPIGHGELKLKKRWQLAKTLRLAQYTRAYVLPNSLKSALVPFFARIPTRIGWKGEWRYGVLTECRRLNKNRYPKLVQRFVALAQDKKAEPLLETLFPKLVVEQTKIKQRLAAFSLTRTQPCLALCPGAEFGPAKKWPEAHYAAVARHYLAKGWQVWLFGSKNDTATAAAINQRCDERCKDLTGKTTLAEAIDLLSVADAVVSNDSGLMHIAAALSRPLVAVYGSSSPLFTPPLGNKVRIVSQTLPCSPCFKRECPLSHQNCLTELLPPSVLQALDDLLLGTTLCPA